jgi:diguanylate cyclase (GGDEF)-like protein
MQGGNSRETNLSENLNKIKRPDNFIYRFSLTLKTVVLVLSIGAIALLVSDKINNFTVDHVFENYIQGLLNRTALGYRLNFAKHVNAHHQLAKVMSTQSNVIRHIEKTSWGSENIEIADHASPPKWVPGNTLARSFGSPKFFLLLDDIGNVRETYSVRGATLPDLLLNIPPRLLMLSDGESHLAFLGGEPGLVTSEPVFDVKGNHAATIFIANLIDEEFLLASQNLTQEGVIITLIDEKGNIFVSSNPENAPPGTDSESMLKDHLMIGHDFLEYGGSELNFKFASFINRDIVERLVSPIISKDRLNHVVQIILFLLIFGILMYFRAQRLKDMTARLTEFSKKKLGGSQVGSENWDEIYMLEERFKLLTEEVQQSAERIRIEVSKKVKAGEQLAHKERQLSLLQAVTEAMGIGVAIATDGNVVPINSKMEYFCEMYGEPDCFNINEGNSWDLEIEFKDKSRHIFNVMSPSLDVGEKIILATDVTDQKKALEEIVQSKNDWESTFDSITDMITIHDSDFNLIAANKAARNSPHLNDVLMGKAKCFKHSHGDSDPMEKCPTCECLITFKPATVEIYEPLMDKFIELRAIPRFDSDGSINGIIHVIRNISARKKLEAELKRHAFYDTLTNLPNKALFLDRLQNLLEHKKREEELHFAVLFLDLDNFKKVNDSMGHVTGDELLIKVSKRLNKCIRPGDTVSRFGGDEFAILLDNIGRVSDVIEVADCLHNRVKEPFIISGREVHTSVSIGIAIADSNYNKPEELLRDADTAMYHAKTLGRGRHIMFSDHMHSSVVEYISLENDLRKALEKGELMLHYQPIIDLELGDVAGMEALLRWEHPKRGLVMPDKFIPIAEDSGLIVKLGDWVIKEACRQIRYWEETFSLSDEFYISINTSVKQLFSGLPDTIGKNLMHYEVNPERLRVEITESLFMENPAVAHQMLTKLNNMNIQVYLDDFGTGYSSLSYIHKFPVDALKIDRSFILNIMHDEEAQKIVQAIISLAKSLNIAVIVEGVEDHEQLEIFRKLECRYIQGYIFSKPLESSMVENYILLFKETTKK